MKYLCYSCHEYKLPNKFYIARGKGRGLSGYCRKCSKKHSSEYSIGVGRTVYFKQYKAKNLDRLRAKWKVANAIKAGKMKRGKCGICGKEKAEAHHYDYNKSLEVKWLCRKHHLDKHYT